MGVVRRSRHQRGFNRSGRRQPAGDRKLDQFGKTGHVELLHEAAAIGMDRLGRQRKRASDVCGALACGDKLQNLALAAAQRPQRVGRSVFANVVVDHGLRDLLAQVAPPGLGTLYVDPATLPVGPFLGYNHKGRLVDITYMVPLKDLDAHQNFETLGGVAAGMKLDHTDIQYNPGHPGVEEPHYHIVQWLISPAAVKAEMMK